MFYSSFRHYYVEPRHYSCQEQQEHDLTQLDAWHGRIKHLVLEPASILVFPESIPSTIYTQAICILPTCICYSFESLTASPESLKCPPVKPAAPSSRRITA